MSLEGEKRLQMLMRCVALSQANVKHAKQEHVFVEVEGILCASDQFRRNYHTVTLVCGLQSLGLAEMANHTAREARRGEELCDHRKQVHSYCHQREKKGDIFLGYRKLVSFWSKMPKYDCEHF